MNNPKIIFIFDSIHHVLKAEKILKKEGLPCDLIPVPREISSDCGTAIAVDENTNRAALERLADHHLQFSIFRKAGKGYYKAPA
jgi:hypothetical protein